MSSLPRQATRHLALRVRMVSSRAALGPVVDVNLLFSDVLLDDLLIFDDLLADKQHFFDHRSPLYHDLFFDHRNPDLVAVVHDFGFECAGVAFERDALHAHLLAPLGNTNLLAVSSLPLMDSYGAGLAFSGAGPKFLFGPLYP